MHGGKDFETLERERNVSRNRMHGDFPSTINKIPCQSATVTQRMQGGIGELRELGAKLSEILDRIQGPRVNCVSEKTLLDEPGLQGVVDNFRRLTGQLNGIAEEILIHL